jgi:phosphomethylpyrimidine synthase
MCGPHFCSTKILKAYESDATEQGLAEEEAFEKGMEEKRREFMGKGGELYAKA